MFMDGQLRWTVAQQHRCLRILKIVLKKYAWLFCTTGFKDRHYFSEPRLFHSKMTAKSGELASDVLLGRDSSAGGGGSRQSGYKGM